MKLDVIFKVQSIIDERAIPVDILELLDTTYYSKSKDRDIRLGDMDITHFVRVYNNKDVDFIIIKSKILFCRPLILKEYKTNFDIFHG